MQLATAGSYNCRCWPFSCNMYLSQFGRRYVSISFYYQRNYIDLYSLIPKDNLLFCPEVWCTLASCNWIFMFMISKILPNPYQIVVYFFLFYCTSLRLKQRLVKVKYTFQVWLIVDVGIKVYSIYGVVMSVWPMSLHAINIAE